MVLRYFEVILFKSFSFIAMFFHAFIYFLFIIFPLSEIILVFDLIDMNFSKLSFSFFFDMYSYLFSRFILLISCVVLYYSLYYMDIERNSIRFLSLVVLFVGSILLLVYLPSLLGMILGWDGLGVSSFLLVIFYNNTSSLRSGILTIYVNRVGDIFFIFSYFFLFSVGVFTIDIFFSFFDPLFFVFILIAGITKRAQIPFSSWLPAAISAPTPVSSLVHSSTLVTAGVYIFIRFYYMLRFLVVGGFFYIISTLTFFSAGLMACVETDLKKLVAMSTLSQLGLIMFSFCMGNFFLTFFHIVRHALFKSLLFLTCGFIILVTFSSQDMRFIGRKISIRKGVFYLMSLSVIRLVGVFFLRGFFSKDLVVDMAYRLDLSLVSLFFFSLSCLLSVYYRVKFIYEAFFRIQLSFSQVVGLPMRYAYFFLTFLFIWSILFSKKFFFYFFDGELVCLSKWQKLVGGVFLLVGVFLFFVGVYKLLWVVSNFMTEIYFLNWFFGGFSREKLFFAGSFLVGEFYWLEKLGAMGINEAISNVFKIFSSSKNYFLVCVIILILLGIFSFILLVSLYKVLLWRSKEFR